MQLPPQRLQQNSLAHQLINVQLVAATTKSAYTSVVIIEATRKWKDQACRGYGYHT